MHVTPEPFDLVVRGARWFDGTGAPSAVRDVGVRAGRVARVSATPLDTTGCPEVVEAAGRWVLPGLVDIHTHYDVEVLDGPGLAESLRHGVTTVLLGSCSISTVHVDPATAGDLFGRVEAIPRPFVVRTLERARGRDGWRGAGEYAAMLDALPLGPNVAAFLGHSDVRAATMGLDRATRRDVRPTESELGRMRRAVEEALDAGFVGMSAQELAFDKLDGDLCRSRTLPSTYARHRERSVLRRPLRERDRVLQGGPDITDVRSIARMVLGTLPARGGRLRTSLLSAADLKANRAIVRTMGPLAALTGALGGELKWQHLPVPFEVYADGIDLVIFEELGAGAAALHLADRVERDALLADEEYRRRFRREYDARFGMRVWHRDFFDAEIVSCPDDGVVGRTFGQVGVERGGLHPVDAFLDLVVEHGAKLRWRTTISNDRPDVLDRLARDRHVQMGFSDAGAHLRNMAFYNFGLRLLRRAHAAAGEPGTPFLTVEQAVHRLTGELADWYGVAAGHLREGDRADLVVVDPDALDDRLDAYAESPVPAFDHLPRMVNRNDAAVPLVTVAGRAVVRDGVPVPDVGTRRTGRFLTAGGA
ncbi:N-acyl-D-amino-acid deacylase family protein [Nocardioides sp. CPCC 205120]|uniref:N-acyl-D-amino-acid deacylase family protein n=1 Tax=Nocardioides sp. CPCC 205120 TaxID=3406462 RepID=UPI003B50E5E6